MRKTRGKGRGEAGRRVGVRTRKGQWYDLLDDSPMLAVGMLIFKKFFSGVENFNSRELHRVSISSGIRILRKKYGRRCVHGDV